MTTPTTPALLKLCAALYLLLILAEWRHKRSLSRFLLQLLLLATLLTLDIAVATAQNGYVSFGPEGSSAWVALAMFAAILLGVAARYIFYLRGQFAWLDFLKPLYISPILLLPLIGSLQSVKSLEPMQIVSFALLAFQNGFFWQAVLQQARPRK